MGKTEAITSLLGVYAFTQVAEGAMTPEQAVYAWSVAGTVVGAVLGGMHLKNAGWLQRTMRFAMCAGGGLIFAPFAIAHIPRAESTPTWWHAFAASGISAFIAWIIVDELGPLVRDEIREWRKRRAAKR